MIQISRIRDGNRNWYGDTIVDFLRKVSSFCARSRLDQRRLPPGELLIASPLPSAYGTSCFSLLAGFNGSHPRPQAGGCVGKGNAGVTPHDPQPRS